MYLTKNFTLRRKYGFRVSCHKYALGLFVYLNFASLVNMDVCQKKNAEMCQVRHLYVTRFTKIGLMKQYQILTKAKINFVSNMASRSTVSLKPFASKL